MTKLGRLFLCIFCTIFRANTEIAEAESFILHNYPRDTVIGAVGNTLTKEEDTLADIARRFDLGYEEIVKANPSVNRWVPGRGTTVVIPAQYVLPDAPYEGIVINLAELRLYFFPQSEGGDSPMVHTFPVSIGRMDWRSPLGLTKIVAKERDPAWYPPPSIRAEQAAAGIDLPDYIPGGAPNNPLGHYALKLALPLYLIHGTDEQKTQGIGMRVTHGCIRMYPEDIERLYSLASVGTPVRFVDQPVKAGWRRAELFLEVHLPFKEDREEFELYSHRFRLEEVLAVLTSVGGDPSALSNRIVQSVLARGNGIPTVISRTVSGLPPAQIKPFPNHLR